jgi:predicted nucleotide-binding protein (sugar kinase/HSP70/actin superfamily)
VVKRKVKPVAIMFSALYISDLLSEMWRYIFAPIVPEISELSLFFEGHVHVRVVSSLPELSAVAVADVTFCG